MAINTTTLGVDNEYVEAIPRLIAGVLVTVFVWAFMPTPAADELLSQLLLKYGAVLFTVGSVAIVVAIWLYPAPTNRRYLLCIALDIAGVSGGLYFGAGTIDPVAVFYLWIILGSGIVYGIRYLYVSTVLSLVAFAGVYAANPYWQENAMFSMSIAGIMVILAPYLTLLLQNLQRARNDVTWQARHDELTGLTNRRAFTTALTELLELRSDAPHYLLYCDLDRFKEINDSAGHAAGDEVLRDVSRLFLQHTDEPSIIARMGGDEFCAVLVDSTLEDARRCAERLRNEVASYRLAWGTSYYSLGVSIGVAPSSSTMDAGGLIRLADAACYAAKNGGRNQVHVVEALLGIDDTQAIRRIKLPVEHPQERRNVRNLA